MPECIEARTDHVGTVTLPTGIELPANRREFVVVLDEAPATAAPTVMRPSAPAADGNLTQVWAEAAARGADANRTPAWSADAPVSALRYRLDRVHAEGGMGQTYIGTDLVTGNAVCVKRLRPGVSPAHLEHEWRACEPLTRCATLITSTTTACRTS